MPISLIGSLNGEPFTFRPEAGLYSDNTPWMKGLPPAEMDIEAVVIRQSNLQDFMACLMYASSFETEGTTEKPSLVIPFFPGARQDRSNPTGDVLNTKAWMSWLVDDISDHFCEVLVFDMHSPKNNPKKIVNVTPAQIMVAATNLGIKTNPTEGYYDTIIAPDHGARARAEEIGALYHTPVIVADKVRDVSTGYITHYEIDTTQTVMEKVLVVDDICDGGATFKILAESLPDKAEKHLFVTHGLFSRGIVTTSSQQTLSLQKKTPHHTCT
jgi:ribose-phosphate pyrophosphokinase